MAIVRIPEQGRTLKTKEAITRYLAGINIEYQTWTADQPLSAEATSDSRASRRSRRASPESGPPGK